MKLQVISSGWFLGNEIDGGDSVTSQAQLLRKVIRDAAAQEGSSGLDELVFASPETNRTSSPKGAAGPSAGETESSPSADTHHSNNPRERNLSVRNDTY